MPRSRAIATGWSETFLDREQAGSGSLADSIARGHSIIQIHTLANSAEVDMLKAEAAAAACVEKADSSDLDFQRRVVALRAAYLTAQQPWRTSTAVPGAGLEAGRQRIPILRLTAPGQGLCDTLLLRAISLMGELAGVLFGQVFANATSLVSNPELDFSAGEPAVNVCKTARRPRTCLELCRPLGLTHDLPDAFLLPQRWTDRTIPVQTTLAAASRRTRTGKR